MQKVLIGALMSLAFVTSPAAAADYGVARAETIVDVPIEKAWAAVGPFCAIEVWSPDHAPCTLVGSDDVGGVRRMNPDNLVELMVAKTRYSYTYVQPEKNLLFHGTLAAEAVGKRRTRLMYTSFYDQAPFPTDAAKAAERKRREDRWTFQMTRMKAVAERAK